MSSRVDMDALDNVGAEKVIALKNLHASKVRLLMRTINNQKAEIEKLKRATKDAKMAKKVQSQARKLREMEMTVDVCKEKLLSNNEFDSEFQVNDFVLKKTSGAPLRFRPKTREKLQNEISELEKGNKRLQAKLKLASDQPKPTKSLELLTTTSREQEFDKRPEGDGAGVKALLEQLEQLKVAVASRDLNLRTHTNEMERMHSEMREMRIFEEKFHRLERKLKHQKTHVQELEDELDDVMRDKEKYQHEKEQLKAELQYLKDETPGKSDGGGEELGYLNDLRRLEGHVMQLEHEMEEKQRKAASMAQKVNQLKSQLRKYEDINTESSSNLLLLKGENQSLLQQLQETKSQLEKSHQQHKQSEIELGKTQHMQQIASTNQSRTDELEHELAQADYEIRQLEQEVQMLRDELQDTSQVARGGADVNNSNKERQESLARIRELEDALRIEKETSADLHKTVTSLKSQNHQLIEWKTETHAQLEEEKKMLERKLHAANLLRRKR